MPSSCRWPLSVRQKPGSTTPSSRWLLSFAARRRISTTCRASARPGLSRVSLDADIPVSFGVLTCDSIEQALERAGTKAGNKGADAAMTAIEMVSLLRQLDA